MVLNRQLRHDGCMTSRELAGEFWFCMEHRRVEKLEDTDSANRIGPFSTEEQAAHALETIHEREKAYDAEDSAWENGD
jgi:hypothetical protein